MSAGHQAETRSGERIDDEFDVFFCFHSLDESELAPIRQVLRSYNVSTWDERTDMLGGDDWARTVADVLEKVSAAVVLFGKNGIGPAQLRELNQISKMAGDKQCRLIPVALPGATIPDDCIPVAGLSPIRFTSANDEKAAFKLIQSITGRNLAAESRAEHLIHVEVPVADHTCFLAFPSDASEPGNSELFDLSLEAIQQAGVAVAQPVDSTKDGFRPDVGAIRSAAIMVGDCTVNGEVDSIDPIVAYQLGMANALGKPIILLTDSPARPTKLKGFTAQKLISYDRSAPGWQDKFRDELAEATRQLDAAQFPPFLVHHEMSDVYVTRADLFHTRVSFWSRLRQILIPLLRVQHAFRNAAQPLQRLHDTVEAILLDEDAIHDRRVQVPQSLLQERYRGLREVHISADCEATLSMAADPDSDVDRSLRFLRKRIAGKPRESIIRAERYLRLVKSEIVQYQDFSNKLEKIMTNPNSTDGVASQADVQVAQLIALATFIQVHTQKVMEHLLEVIGGDTSSASRQTSTNGAI